MKITYVGHAKALIEAGGVRLITDPAFSEPVYCNTLWHYPPLAIGLDDLPSLDYIYISHHHADHFDPASLARLNKSAAVIVPALDAGWEPMNSTDHRDRFHRAIRHLGFKEVYALRAWETIELAPDVTATMVPAATLEPDSSLVFQSEGATIFIQNDNSLGDPVCKTLAQRFPVIDVGLMFCGASVGYPAVADLPDAVQAQEAHRRKYEHFFPLARRYLELLRPRLFVPFANDLAWLAPQDVWINRLCKTPPGHFIEYLAAHPVPGVTPMQMNSGDEWTPAAGLRRLNPAPDLTRFFDDLEAYARAIEPTTRGLFESEREIDTTGLRDLWLTRLQAVCTARRASLKKLGRLTVYFRVEGTHPGDYYLAFADGAFVVGEGVPVEGWDLRIRVDDFLLARALLGELEFQAIRNSRWRISHPGGYTQEVRRFWMWLFVEVDSYLARLRDDSAAGGSRCSGASSLHARTASGA
jgi:L-ascorbate metabolism protein UlaG (beta-lactamase superfamily)